MKLKTNCEILGEIGYTICCDGWTSINNRHFLNILCVPPKGKMFKKTINTSG
jgi:hypothetical protein